MWNVVKVEADSIVGSTRDRRTDGQIVDVEGLESVQFDLPGSEDIPVRVCRKCGLEVWDDGDMTGLPDCGKGGTHEPERVLFDWASSAGVTVKAEDETIRFWISIGDPRGAMCFDVRRLPDGRIVVHLPYPEEPTPHVKTRWLHNGTLELVTE